MKQKGDRMTMRNDLIYAFVCGRLTYQCVRSILRTPEGCKVKQ